MKAEIPENIQILLDELVDNFKKLLGDNLIGVYLHGSLAMGSYNPFSSDVDLLIVVKSKLTVSIKKQIGILMVGLTERLPAGNHNGFEISVVTLDTLEKFKYPTPFEFHFSNAHKEKFINNEVDFEKESDDPDLAAHFVITKKRGVCLYGESIEKIFPDIPKEYYLQSIIQDTKWSLGNVAGGRNEGECRVPVYAVLNFCRVLAFIGKNLITSKSEGGEWALKHLPKEYYPVIYEALNEYKKSGSAKLVNAKLLKDFGVYVGDKIGPL